MAVFQIRITFWRRTQLAFWRWQLKATLSTPLLAAFVNKSKQTEAKAQSVIDLVFELSRAA